MEPLPVCIEGNQYLLPLFPPSKLSRLGQLLNVTPTSLGIARAFVPRSRNGVSETCNIRPPTSLRPPHCECLGRIRDPRRLPSPLAWRGGIGTIPRPLLAGPSATQAAAAKRWQTVLAGGHCTICMQLRTQLSPLGLAASRGAEEPGSWP